MKKMKKNNNKFKSKNHFDKFVAEKLNLEKNKLIKSLKKCLIDDIKSKNKVDDLSQNGIYKS
jgi:hypothetical protein